MRGNLAEEVTGGLSWPSKMDCPAWGISATKCKIGHVLGQQEGTVCRSCYALKGTFRSANVERKMQKSYDGMFDERWTPAMYALIRLHAKDRFRFFHSGDIQSKSHLLNILRICTELRDVLFWIPTREAAVVKECQDAIPDNARVRLSGHMIDGPAPKWWKHTSSVVSDHRNATCPSSVKGGNCGTHGCTSCWSRKDEVKYLKH